MLLIDCTELSADEKIALASQISDTMDGLAIALVKGENVVLDSLTDQKPDFERVKGAVADFISRRKDAEHYSMEADGERIMVHSADPVAAQSRKRQNKLPPNLFQCMYCAFVTEHQELLTVHERAHLFGA